MACAGSSIDFADFPWAKSQDLLQGAQTQADGRHLAIDFTLAVHCTVENDKKCQKLW
jgi:hypothetical protein